MNPVLLIQTKNGRFEKIGEIKELPTLSCPEPTTEEKKLYTSFREPASLSFSFTVKFSKSFSKHLHYAKHSKKFRQRKKHVKKLIEIRNRMIESWRREWIE